MDWGRVARHHSFIVHSIVGLFQLKQLACCHDLQDRHSIPRNAGGRLPPPTPRLWPVVPRAVWV